ncbi:hypothetical protein HanPI659440_Chr07g0261721 [Helianthus annuus]|nr:hypothetical protein HanPI659440_Chr07g0261721 [Helianthus annuus]
MKRQRIPEKCHVTSLNREWTSLSHHARGANSKAVKTYGRFAQTKASTPLASHKGPHYTEFEFGHVLGFITRYTITWTKINNQMTNLAAMERIWKCKKLRLKVLKILDQDSRLLTIQFYHFLIFYDYGYKL